MDGISYGGSSHHTYESRLIPSTYVFFFTLRYILLTNIALFQAVLWQSENLTQQLMLCIHVQGGYFTVQRWWSLVLGLVVLFYNLQNTRIRSSEESDDSKRNHCQVLPEYPVASTQALLRAPVHDDLHDGREHETQEREADGSHQGDEGAQVRHHYSNAN